jgi:hypothetical protein
LVIAPQVQLAFNRSRTDSKGQHVSVRDASGETILVSLYYNGANVQLKLPQIRTGGDGAAAYGKTNKPDEVLGYKAPIPLSSKPEGTVRTLGRSYHGQGRYRRY